MSPTTTDEPKKGEKPKRDETKLPVKPEVDKDDHPVYTEKVSVRLLNGDKFLNPKDDVPGTLCKNKDGDLVWWLKSGGVSSGKPPKGSEITDADGIIYVVDRVSQNGNPYVCYVTKKKP